MGNARRKEFNKSDAKSKSPYTYGVPKAANDNFQHQTIDSQFNDSYARRRSQLPNDKTRNVKTSPGSVTGFPSDKSVMIQGRSGKMRRKKKLDSKYVMVRGKNGKMKRKKKGDLMTTVARTKATALNLSFWSFGGFWWIIFQVPLAMLSLMFFGLAALVSEAFEIDPDDSTGKKVLKFFIKGFAKGFKTVSDAINKTLHIDIAGFIGALHPINFWAVTWVIILAFGFIVMISMAIVYKMSFLNPFSGKGAGLKWITFCLCITLYAVPVLNLFPWFIAYTIVIWHYPK